MNNLNDKLSDEEQNQPSCLGDVMPSCLRLSLKTKWFEMTKAGIKKEDYREINEYWITRLVNPLRDRNMIITYLTKESLINGLSIERGFKAFDINTMTLGYPKSTDSDRILKLKHKGIEIRTGNPEWGAEPNKLYFVIMHGDILA